MFNNIHARSLILAVLGLVLIFPLGWLYETAIFSWIFGVFPILQTIFAAIPVGVSVVALIMALVNRSMYSIKLAVILSLLNIGWHVWIVASELLR